jgi:hypothetical protein
MRDNSLLHRMSSELKLEKNIRLVLKNGKIIDFPIIETIQRSSLRFKT